MRIATATLLASAVLPKFGWKRLIDNNHPLGQQLLYQVLWSLFLWILPPHSPYLAAWYPATRLWTLWPRLWPSAPVSWRHKSPLGGACSKVGEVLTGALLWRLETGDRPVLKMGPWPSAMVWSGLVLFSGTVNGVLWFWSNWLAGKSRHAGVDAVVEDSLQRKLSLGEHGQLMAWATANAICEEIVSRGYWRLALAGIGWNVTEANVGQAAIFGIWHWHGIPSGVVGVALTFVYGLIMGALADYGGGLLWPILAHAMADYYIFACIARQPKKQT